MTAEPIPTPAPQPVEHFAEAEVPTSWGTFDIHVYRAVNNTGDNTEHVALVMGPVEIGTVEIDNVEHAPLVRVHSECLTGDVLGSLRCDCGTQISSALEAIAQETWGVLVYLRGHEGRGIGIGHKIRAYALQDHGLDTLEANAAQGLPIDARRYDTAAAILADLGVRTARLMTNNPAKLAALAAAGLNITQQVPLRSEPTPTNAHYLETKRLRLNHTL